MIDPLVIARAVHIAATAMIAGVIFFEVIVARPALGGRASPTSASYFATLRFLLLLLLLLAVISGLAWALFVAAQLGDGSPRVALMDGTFATLLTETRFGQVWVWRGVAAIVLTLTMLSEKLAYIRLAVACLMLAAIAWIGHSGARADAVGWLQVCADMAHLLAAGLWLGSLPALTIMLAGNLSPSVMGKSTRRFSQFGVAAVTTLLVTGVFNAYLLTDSVRDLIDTRYGQLLLLKVVLFVAMLVLAATNRWIWMPRLPNRRAISAIRRQSLLEMALGLAVILAVGILGTLPPPLHRHAHSSEAPAEAAFAHIHDVTGMADVTVLPGRPGPSEIWIRLMREDFTPLPAQALSVRLSQPGQPNIVADAQTGAPGLWRVPDLTLPTAGVWTIVIEADTGKGERLVLDAPIVLGSTPKSE